MRRSALLVVLAAVLLASCNRGPDPYLKASDRQGTPSDRTGGSINEPDGAGGGPNSHQNPANESK